jgi:glycosyltransferase involved in cell wall biosynthesis
MKVAIVASNIRAGGGITHLVECLGALDPTACGVHSVTVYAGTEALSQIRDRPWLRKVLPAELQRGLRFPVWWRLSTSGVMIDANPDVLLVPGGSYLGPFRPFVALAQNLLPFDGNEQRREGWTLKRMRLLLLARVQGSTFRRADGVIFMSAVSRDHIERRMGFQARRSRVVHHGASPRFARSPADSASVVRFSAERPLRLLYVSILEPYKHQRVVAAAIADCRRRGLSVTLDMVGPAAHGEAAALEAEIARLGCSGHVRYLGPVGYNRLQEVYAQADAFVFASSCETFGIILLEAMAAGLPLLCSHRSALPEVAGDAALYFDPLDIDSLSRAVAEICANSRLREALAFHGRRRAAAFSWERCAAETFGFLRETLTDFRQGRES